MYYLFRNSIRTEANINYNSDRRVRKNSKVCKIFTVIEMEMHMQNIGPYDDNNSLKVIQMKQMSLS